MPQVSISENIFFLRQRRWDKISWSVCFGNVFSGLGKKGIKVSSTVSQLVESKHASLFSPTVSDEDKNIFIPLTPEGLVQ
jgi:hypothetical protein